VIETLVSSSHLVAAGARRLRDAGVEQAGREARWLWEKVGGQTHVAQVTRSDKPVPAAVAARYEAFINRRSRGEPLAHVLGKAVFRHLVVQSDARALIPRPETEGLVDLVLERQRTGIVADIGTGTGCVALSLASEGDYDLVLALEYSRAALSLARANAERLRSPVVLVRGDLCEGLTGGQLDVLVSNPPYLTDREYETLPPAVKDWEPAQALRSGTDGLETIRRLVRDGLRVVKPNGWMILEVDCSRAAQVAAEAVHEGWLDVLVKDDLFGRARYLVARRSGS
jgi:release factor glutamine methyltransferase